jgi:hypothetical protein
MARKIMVLDYVLAHPELDWLAAEDDKVDLFAGRIGVPHTDLQTASSTPRSLARRAPFGTSRTSSPSRSRVIRRSRTSFISRWTVPDRA